MKKFLLVCISLVISLLQPCLQSAHAQDVESFVRDFYKWYLKQSLSFVKQPQPLFEKLPVFDQDIFKYVCRCTAKRVQFDYNRGVGGNGADYYIKGQDVVKEQLEDFKIGGSIDVSDNLRLVSVRHCIPARFKIFYLTIAHRIKIILIWCNTVKMILIKKI